MPLHFKGVRAISYFSSIFSAQCIFRMNRLVIATMFIRPSVHFSACLSICLSGMDVHCDHTVHFSVDLNSRIWIVQCSGHSDTKLVHLLPTVFFQFHLEERWGMDVQTRRSINANNDKQVLDRWI